MKKGKTGVGTPIRTDACNTYIAGIAYKLFGSASLIVVVNYD